jgi:hypothetical protein
MAGESECTNRAVSVSGSSARDVVRKAFEMNSDFWVIACYFNPARFKTKRLNFDAFMGGMRDVGANVLVVESAFGDDPFELESGENVLQLRGTGVMWQKERLLNIAAAKLPASARKIGWFDADIIFKEPDWLERTSQALDKYVVVQPFSHAVRLHRDNRDDGSGILDRSFASMFVENPRPARMGRYQVHGHTGYAWAARRELFEKCGLYDACLTGSGDHIMAHAFAAGMKQSPCLVHTFGQSRAYADHFLRWAMPTRDLVGARLGVVPGRILHLWHGDLEDRRYRDREVQFRRLGFDPRVHLRLDDNGLWEWSDEAPDTLKAWADNSFHRNEDGDKARAAQEHTASRRQAAG